MIVGAETITLDGLIGMLLLFAVAVAWLVSFGPGIAIGVFLARRTYRFQLGRGFGQWPSTAGAGLIWVLTYVAWAPIGVVALFFFFDAAYWFDRTLT